MKLTSPAFKEGERIPDKYVMQAIGGQNMSFPFEWENTPIETKSFALSIVDPHPVANNWVHWLAFNIPADSRSLPEGASINNMPGGSVELQNSYGSIGYGGPQPPKGSGLHPYVCALYALNVGKLDLDPKVSLSEFRKSLEGKILAKATIEGKYGK